MSDMKERPRPLCPECAKVDTECICHTPAAIEQARPQPPEVCRYCLQTRIPIDVRLTLERERTKVCDGVNAIKKALHSRSWLTEGRGSYTYDDDRWMDEFASAIQEIQTALIPLERIAGDHSNCPIETSEVIEARKPIDTAAATPSRAVKFAQFVRDYFSDGHAMFEEKYPECEPLSNEEMAEYMRIAADEVLEGTKTPTT